MSASYIIVIQGAGEGAYDEDRPLADFVQDLAADDDDFAYPKIDGLETLNWSRAAAEIAAAFDGVGDGCKVVAHSLGGAALLKLLSEGGKLPRIDGLFLVATPYKCKDGEFGTDAFALDNGFAARLPSIGRIQFYHGRDDDFLQVSHVERYAEKLPHAIIEIVDGQGHQFADKPFTELARDMATLQSVTMEDSSS